MNKYGPKAQKLIDETMDKYKKGQLKSGGSGRTVKDRRQAVAIAIEEARDKGYKVPTRGSD